LHENNDGGSQTQQQQQPEEQHKQRPNAMTGLKNTSFLLRAGCFMAQECGLFGLQ
jgi:hypothetical protein